jgi:transposase
MLRVFFWFVLAGLFVQAWMVPLDLQDNPTVDNQPIISANRISFSGAPVGEPYSRVEEWWAVLAEAEKQSCLLAGRRPCKRGDKQRVKRRGWRARKWLVRLAWRQLKPMLREVVKELVTVEQLGTEPKGSAAFCQPMQIVVVTPDYSQTRCEICGGATKCKHSYYSHPQDINLEQPTVLQVYREVRECLDSTCKGRIVPELDFVEKGGRFTKRTKQAVIAAVTEDGVPINRVPQRMWRDFHVRVAASTVHEWVHAAAEADLGEKEYTQWVVVRFSGVIGIDEVHERDENGKKQYLIVAVDPINDRTVRFDLLESNDSETFTHFLEKLKAMGINPQVIITDMWQAYRSAIAEVFPEAVQQLCVFHVIKNVMEHTYEAMLSYRRALPDETEAQKATKRELWDYRYLLLQANPNLTDKQRDLLEDIMHTHQNTVLTQAYYCKEAILALFRKSRTKRGARTRRDIILRRFGDVPELEKVLNLLRGDQFEQMIVYLDYENLDKTNNNAERTNRTYQKGEKTRYRSRTTRTRLNYVKHQARLRNRRSTERNERLKRRKQPLMALANRLDAVAEQEARRLAA